MLHLFKQTQYTTCSLGIVGSYYTAVGLAVGLFLPSSNQYASTIAYCPSGNHVKHNSQHKDNMTWSGFEPGTSACHRSGGELGTTTPPGTSTLLVVEQGTRL